jgi:hypothetical protein
MTTSSMLTTIYADSRADGEWDGETARISLYAKTSEGEALVGQVTLTRHTILLMHVAVGKAINGAFKNRAKVVKFRPKLHAVKGA